MTENEYGGPSWLIYAKGRKHSEQRPAKADATADQGCEGVTNSKAYFEADWSPCAGWSLGKRVKAMVTHGGSKSFDPTCSTAPLASIASRMGSS